MKNKSDIKVMLKEAGILFAITLIAGFVLGFVYELTKEPIRLQKEMAVRNACAEVFADASDFQEIAYTPDARVATELANRGIKIGTVYEAQGASGEGMGYVIQSTSTEGYGGNIVLYAGVTKEGILNDISILDISETPGLGMKAEDELVPQFHQQPVTWFVYTKNGSTSEGEIDAISGATVTTSAVTNAVNGTMLVYEDIMRGGGGNE